MNIILFNLRGSVIILLIKTVNSISGMAIAKGVDVVLERPLVLEIGAARAVPELAAVLLVGSPVASDGEGLAAFPAHEGLDPMLPLVMCLESSEVLERP